MTDTVVAFVCALAAFVVGAVVGGRLSKRSFLAQIRRVRDEAKFYMREEIQEGASRALFVLEDRVLSPLEGLHERNKPGARAGRTQ